MKVLFKKVHPDAKLPTKTHDLDTGYDLFACEDALIYAKPIDNKTNVVSIGIEVAHIEPGYWFQICARSGLGFKFGCMPFAGIIDQNYRGIVGLKLILFENSLGFDGTLKINKGDRVAQIVFFPLIQAEIGWSEEKTQTDRGEGGFGSTGR